MKILRTAGAKSLFGCGWNELAGNACVFTSLGAVLFNCVGNFEAFPPGCIAGLLEQQAHFCYLNFFTNFPPLYWNSSVAFLLTHSLTFYPFSFPWTSLVSPCSFVILTFYNQNVVILLSSQYLLLLTLFFLQSSWVLRACLWHLLLDLILFYSCPWKSQTLRINLENYLLL